MTEGVVQAEKYWNSSDIITEFANAAAPAYWKEFFEVMESKDKISVLDLGCGGGRNTVMLAKMGFRISACDLHVGMVETTRNRLRELGVERWEDVVQQQNMLHLTYNQASFDIVLANGIYHNTSNLQEFQTAIAETSRVIKDNGYLCMNVFTDQELDASLKKQDTEYLYLTPDNLDMILLPEEKIIEILKRNKLIPIVTPVSYISKINCGNRSIIRGVFKKVSC